MPTGQHYATNVPQAQLTTGINNSVTSFAVNSLSGWPSPPFTAVLEIGQSVQEPIDITGISGNNVTSCVRGIDGTTPFAHSIGATLTHADIGRDFRESRAHIDASSTPDSTGASVHGIANGSNVVGTTDSQSLSNKTIVSGIYSGAQTMGSGAWSGTGALVESTVGFTGITGAASGTTRLSGQTASGAPSSGAFNTGDIVYDATYNALWVCTSGGSPGTWTLLGGRALIGTTTPTGASSTTFTIPSWANSVFGVWTARTDNATTGGYVNLRFNGDTGSNYVWEQVLANSSTVTGQNSGGTNAFMHIGAKTAANDTANYFGTGSFTAVNLQSTGLFKSASSISQAPGSTTSGFAGTHGGTWLSTAAVTSLTLVADAGNFVAGSRFSLYGMV